MGDDLALAGLRRLARYNRWMNRRLYAACDQLGDAGRRADRGAFFRSIHGTLNHLALGDRLWLTHWSGQGVLPPLDAAIRLDDVDSLAQELYPDYAALAAARRQIDDILVAVLDAASAQALQRECVETWPDGRTIRRAWWLELQHLFNHQTHHRGQVTTLLMQAGVDPGVTDLVAMPEHD